MKQTLFPVRIGLQPVKEIAPTPREGTRPTGFVRSGCRPGALTGRFSTGWFVLAAVIYLGALALPMLAQVLFDNTKAETAGNADWIIDTHQPVPSPSITGISAGTSETYWTGALSSWGVALAKLGNAGQISLPGNGLETLPTSGRITYGDGSNAQDLSHYKVYVVCEPNIAFTAAEKTAILTFVQNGGGLFMVADHNGSDRNNDGIDSLAVWNDLLTANTVQANPFGFTFNVDSGTPTATVDSSPSNPMTHGIGGTVTTLVYDVGCTMNLTDTSVAHAAAWQTNPTKVMALYGTFGAGRFCAIGDSSVVEDITSSQGTTYNGWTSGDNGACVINGMVWLLNAGASSSNQPPGVTTSAATSVGTTNATLNGSLNPKGQSTTAQFEYGLTTNYGTTVLLSGTFTGTNSLAVSTNLTGLTAGTAYHFRLTATNLSGRTLGADQSFTTTAVINSNQPPSVTTSTATSVGTTNATLNGSLNPNNSATTAQFEYGLTTNYGTALPLTATFTGSNSMVVSTNLVSLTPGTAYHFRLTATNANGRTFGVDQGFTTISTNSSGTNSYSGLLAGWEVTGLGAYGPSPFAATTNAPYVTVGGLTRGSGVGTANTAASNSWGGTGFVFANEAAAITSNSFATFSVTANAGYRVSFTNIPAYNIRRSATGSSTGIWQYQVGGGAFTDIGSAITWGAVTTSAGNPETAIDLSGIAALQDIAAGTAVTFRIVLWGGTGTGTWYVNNITGNDLQVLGNIASTVTASNTAPVFTAPLAGSNIVVNAGVNLAVSCTATDSDTPAQSLTYGLLSGPAGAVLATNNGSFNWRPPVSQANSTNPVLVSVTDNGTPALSATNTFTVIVNPLAPPSLTGAAASGGQFFGVVDGPAGPDYTVLVSTNLGSGAWDTLLISNSPALPFNFTDPNGLSPQRFYRVMLGP